MRTLFARQIGQARVEVVAGSLADDLGVNAVVHPTSASIEFDGGVGMALVAKADMKALQKACTEKAPLEVAGSVSTPGFGLPCPHIIHCRGPRYGDEDADETLGKTYWNVLSLAEKNGFHSLAIPAISSGAKGFPLAKSASIAIEVLKSFSPEFQSLRTVRFALPDPESADFFTKELMRPPSFPEKTVRLEIPSVYSPNEFNAMRKSVLGNHDTKWFFYYEEPWLCIYRGIRRSGGCHFWLRLPDGSRSAALEDCLMGMDLPWGKGEAERLVGNLLDNYYELLLIDKEIETVGNVQFWIKRGNLALESSAVDGLLSASQVRDLGQRLLSLADSLTKRENIA